MEIQEFGDSAISQARDDPVSRPVRSHNIYGPARRIHRQYRSIRKSRIGDVMGQMDSRAANGKPSPRGTAPTRKQRHPARQDGTLCRRKESLAGRPNPKWIHLGSEELGAIQDPRVGGICPSSIRGEGSRSITDLPAGFSRESTDLHAVGCSARARSGALVVAKAAARGSFAVTGATGKLDGQALAHEVGSIFASH